MKRIFLVVFFLCVVSALSFAHILGADQNFVIAPSQSLFLATQQTMPIDSLTPYNNGMPGSDRAKNIRTIGFWTFSVGMAAIIASGVLVILAVSQLEGNRYEYENWYEAYPYEFTSAILFSTGMLATITGYGLINWGKPSRQ